MMQYFKKPCIYRVKQQLKILSDMKKLISLFMFAAAFCACSKTEEEVELTDPTKSPAKPIELTRAEYSACEQAKDFSYDFIRQANTAANSKNYFVSPLSAEMALAMLCNGTAGETEQEIRNVLGFKDFTLDDLNSYNQKMLKSLPTLDGRTTVTLTNGFWADKALNLQKSYQNLISDQYDASCFSFDNLEAAKKEINSWCDKHTDHMIKEIMGENDSFVFALVNALYFKGEWSRKFDERETMAKDFHNLNGTTSRVLMMHKTTGTGLFQYGYSDYCHALFMPFGNFAYYFTVILPAEGYTLDDCAAKLNDHEIENLMAQDHGACTLVEMPRFTLDYEYSLNEMLQAMGIKKLYSTEQDLSGMLTTTDPLLITAKQKTRIEVDEKGAKAAAVTHVSGDLTAMPSIRDNSWEFIVDEPFIFLIRERSTGSVLFSGRINEINYK